MVSTTYRHCARWLFYTFLITAAIAPVQPIAQTIDSIKGPVCIAHDSATGKSFTVSPVRSMYNVVVTDGIAHIQLVQLYVNSFCKLKDLVYVFPLPHKGSVHSVSMEYKGNVYVAKIYEKQQAQQTYDSVINSGGTGALLLQDRPNIFQQHLANIGFGDSAYVTIGLSMPLKYDNGTYELAIPTMIGERYQSSGQPFVPSGTFWNPPEDRDGQSLQINVLIQTGFPVTGLVSPTHPLKVDDLPAIRAALESRGVLKPESVVNEPYCKGTILLSQTTYPNRDYVLRFSRKEASRDFSLASYYNQTKKEGYFALNIYPDSTVFAGERPDLDIVLLVDHSGSQSGWPLAAEKAIAGNILTRLTAKDKFTVLAFEDNVTWAFGNSNPQDVTTGTISTAANFINALQPAGGTQLLSGIQAALAVPQTPGHERFFVFLTDGFITNETEILTLIKNHPSKPTVFTFGCGNSINRYLIDGAAETGNGGYGTVITQSEASTMVPFVDAAWQKIETPQLKNITLDFSSISANNLLMPSGTNLFVGRPIEVYSTYTQGGTAMVTVKGFVGANPVEIKKSITFADAENMNYMVPQIWAREYIEKLSADEGTTQVNKAAIIEVSIAYQVLSKYTAFLAINPQKIDPSASAQSQMNGALSAIDRENPGSLKSLLSVKTLMVKIINGILKLFLPNNSYLEKMSIYDLSGRLLHTRLFSAGSHIQSVTWDGRLGNNERLKAGTYVVLLQTTAGKLNTTFCWH